MSDEFFSEESLDWYESYQRALARAEQAEKRVAELEAFHKLDNERCDSLRQDWANATVRAERAEAQLRHMHTFDNQHRGKIADLQAQIAIVRVGMWLSAALEDPSVCKEIKADINAWFAALARTAPPEEA